LFIVKGAGDLISDTNVLKQLLAGMLAAGVATLGIEHVQAGYNPICIFDGQKVDVMPDFCVGHILGQNGSK
jgi:hypothetical protein